jgi:lipoprotein-releasing system ATP-binding protein
LGINNNNKLENILIKTINLIKDYQISKEKYLRVLDNVNIEIIKGEIVSIVGPSGAGKSTLLHLIGTLDKPTSGEVYFENEPLSGIKGDLLAKHRNLKIGFIFQFHHLLPEFTAIENVSMAALIKGDKKNDIYQIAKSLLIDVGLENRINHQPSELSGGEAQRVAIARALINSPKVILADEPTGNLDTANSDEVINLIFELRKKYNQTFVIVTHNEKFATMADRIIRMVDGKIV